MESSKQLLLSGILSVEGKVRGPQQGAPTDGFRFFSGSVSRASPGIHLLSLGTWNWKLRASNKILGAIAPPKDIQSKTSSCTFGAGHLLSFWGNSPRPVMTRHPVFVSSVWDFVSFCKVSYQSSINQDLELCWYLQFACFFLFFCFVF